MKCLICGRFTKNNVATYNDFTARIIKVTGECNKCGKIDLTDGDWIAEDFFPND